MDHVLIRKVEHLTGSKGSPNLGYAIEIRDRKGPAHKVGAFENDVVWIQLHGGLLVAKAKVEICWIGEYSRVDDIRKRVAGTPIYDVENFWEGRPRSGYAAVAELKNEQWIPPYWAGPRTYAYEWVVCESEAKRQSWIEKKDPPRGGEELRRDFDRWLAAR